MEKEVKNSDYIWGDAIHIILGDDIGKVITKYICHEYEEKLTYGEVLEMAKENGFSYGTFLLLVENPLNGIIYQYANCYDGEPYWSEYGQTRGYA